MRDRIPPNAPFDKGDGGTKIATDINTIVSFSLAGSTHSATGIISIPLKPGLVLFRVDNDDRGRHSAALSVVGL